MKKKRRYYFLILKWLACKWNKQLRPCSAASEEIRNEKELRHDFSNPICIEVIFYGTFCLSSFVRFVISRLIFSFHEVMLDTHCGGVMLARIHRHTKPSKDVWHFYLLDAVLVIVREWNYSWMCVSSIFDEKKKQHIFS